MPGIVDGRERGAFATLIASWAARVWPTCRTRESESLEEMLAKPVGQAWRPRGEGARAKLLTAIPLGFPRLHCSNHATTLTTEHHMTTPDNRGEAPIDFAILTAIEVERKAICNIFGLGDRDRVRRGVRVYWRGRLPLANGEFYEIVVAQALDMANVDAALLTSDTIRDWRPGAALLVGIAASAHKDVKLGDVVVASEVYYYERTKISPEGGKPEPRLIAADATLWSRVSTVAEWGGVVLVARPDGSVESPAVLHGIIASGEKVIADAEARDRIASAHRKILAIEMEGFGVSRAVWQSFDRVRHLDIRGICDDGSPSKDDRWHPYAAAAAAAFTRHFLLDRPLDPLSRP